jgi:glycosyltransferase involved in cell wall biosynthesis
MARVRGAGIPNLELIAQTVNGGPGAARNTGVRAAQTDWIAFLDSDDRWEPTFLERVAEAIALHDADFGSSGGLRQLAYRGRTVTSVRLLKAPARDYDLTASFWRTALRFVPIHSSSAVVRKSLFDSVGGFPEDVRNGEDVALWIRLWLHGRFVFVNEPLFVSVAPPHGLSAANLTYHDVRLGLARMAQGVISAARRRRPGTGWFALWFADRLVRRHGSWLRRQLNIRLGRTRGPSSATA